MRDRASALAFGSEFLVHGRSQAGHTRAIDDPPHPTPDVDRIISRLRSVVFASSFPLFACADRLLFSTPRCFRCVGTEIGKDPHQIRVPKKGTAHACSLPFLGAMRTGVAPTYSPILASPRVLARSPPPRLIVFSCAPVIALASRARRPGSRCVYPPRSFSARDQ